MDQEPSHILHMEDTINKIVVVEVEVVEVVVVIVEAILVLVQELHFSKTQKNLSCGLFLSTACPAHITCAPGEI